MAKIDEVVKEIHSIKTAAAVDHARADINKQWWKRVFTVCVTSVTTICGFFIWLGGYIYSHSVAVEAGVRTFIETLRAEQ